MCIVSSAKIVQAKLTTKSMTKFLNNNIAGKEQPLIIATLPLL